MDGRQNQTKSVKRHEDPKTKACSLGVSHCQPLSKQRTQECLLLGVINGPAVLFLILARSRTLWKEHMRGAST